MDRPDYMMMMILISIFELTCEANALPRGYEARPWLNLWRNSSLPRSLIQVDQTGQGPCFPRKGQCTNVSEKDITFL